MNHPDLTLNHRIENFVYATAAARTSAAPVAGDIGKIAFQQDTGQYWRLTSNVGPLWALINTWESWTFANAAARIVVPTPAYQNIDIGKIAFQTDTAQYWRLSATTPVWQLISANVLETYTYASAATRNAATGFVANDVGRVAYQQDTGQYWRVVSQSGGIPTWQPITAGADPLNSSVASQSFTNADTYITNSNCIVGANDFKIKTQYRCLFDMTKTAAGTAAITVTLRIGTTASISDVAATIPFAFLAGTAFADSGTFEVIATFRSVGSGTAAVVQGICVGNHNNVSSGLYASTGTTQVVVGTPTAGFDSTVQTSIGVSFTGNTAFSGTCTLVQASLDLA